MCKPDKIPPQALRPVKSTRSFDYTDIVSTKQATSYYSPSATDTNAPCIDPFLLRDLKAMGSKWGLCGKAWLNKLVRGDHMICFNSKDLHKKDVVPRHRAVQRFGNIRLAGDYRARAGCR